MEWSMSYSTKISFKFDKCEATYFEFNNVCIACSFWTQNFNKFFQKFMQIFKAIQNLVYSSIQSISVEVSYLTKTVSSSCNTDYPWIQAKILGHCHQHVNDLRVRSTLMLSEPPALSQCLLTIALTRWRLVLSIPGLGSMGYACYSIIKSPSMQGCQ